MSLGRVFLLTFIFLTQWIHSLSVISNSAHYNIAYFDFSYYSMSDNFESVLLNNDRLARFSNHTNHITTIPIQLLSETSRLQNNGYILYTTAGNAEVYSLATGIKTIKPYLNPYLGLAAEFFTNGSFEILADMNDDEIFIFSNSVLTSNYSLTILNTVNNKIIGYSNSPSRLFVHDPVTGNYDFFNYNNIFDNYWWNDTFVNLQNMDYQKKGNSNNYSLPGIYPYNYIKFKMPVSNRIICISFYEGDHFLIDINLDDLSYKKNKISIEPRYDSRILNVPSRRSRIVNETIFYAVKFNGNIHLLSLELESHELKINNGFSVYQSDLNNIFSVREQNGEIKYLAESLLYSFPNLAKGSFLKNNLLTGDYHHLESFNYDRYPNDFPNAYFKNIGSKYNLNIGYRKLINTIFGYNGFYAFTSDGGIFQITMEKEKLIHMPQLQPHADILTENNDLLYLPIFKWADKDQNTHTMVIPGTAPDHAAYLGENEICYYERLSSNFITHNYYTGNTETNNNLNAIITSNFPGFTGLQQIKIFDKDVYLFNSSDQLFIYNRGETASVSNITYYIHNSFLVGDKIINFPGPDYSIQNITLSEPIYAAQFFDPPEINKGGTLSIIGLNLDESLDLHLNSQLTNISISSPHKYSSEVLQYNIPDIPMDNYSLSLKKNHQTIKLFTSPLYVGKEFIDNLITTPSVSSRLITSPLFELTLKNITSDTDFEIFDFNGRKRFQKTVGYEDETISIIPLDAGVYLYQFSLNGQVISKGTLLIQE